MISLQSTEGMIVKGRAEAADIDRKDVNARARKFLNLPTQ